MDETEHQWPRALPDSETAPGSPPSDPRHAGRADAPRNHELSHIPMRSLSLRLARSTIKMRHDSRWRIDKVNPVHDLIVCLSGTGIYQVGEDPEPIAIAPGDALLVPAYTRFRGRSGGAALFTGIAQHFTLELFGRGDLIAQMSLSRSIHLPNWPVLLPLVRHYRETSPFGSTTLAQHHQFMVVLLAFLDASFSGWKTEAETPASRDHLSVQIMRVATRLSADPLGSGVEEALRDLPYNPDYFRRAFKERIGHTPRKFREMKRMEFAASRLGMGMSVNAVAAELGFSDPYFFSRMFKRHLGVAPSRYKGRPEGRVPARRDD